LAFEQYIKGKKAVVFGLDNVLYPEKDYLLQVYYLFAEFISYSEQMDAKEILAYMTNEFATNGKINIFEKTADKFNIPLKYSSNFILLHQTARLPLKLLLYQQVLSFLQELVVERVSIFLLVDGKPEEQINKIKQLEWHGLEQYLKVYFTAEFETKSESLNFITNQHQLTKKDLLMVGFENEEKQFAASADIDFLTIQSLI
jgi:phosphoglycolate phosphatase-like HAD superfamily hydrolase